MNKETLELIKYAVEFVEKKGHGEVVVKIKNGVTYRVLTTDDKLIAK